MVESSGLPSHGRTIVAFLVAPLAGAFVGWLTMMVLSPSFGALIYGTAFLAVVLGYPTTLVLGVPIYLVLRRRGIALSAAICVTTGVGIALIAGVLLAMAIKAIALLAFLPLVALSGAVGGWVFWKVGFAGRSA